MYEKKTINQTLVRLSLYMCKWTRNVDCFYIEKHHWHVVIKSWNQCSIRLTEEITSLLHDNPQRYILSRFESVWCNKSVLFLFQDKAVFLLKSKAINYLSCYIIVPVGNWRLHRHRKTVIIPLILLYRLNTRNS